MISTTFGCYCGGTFNLIFDFQMIERLTAMVAATGSSLFMGKRIWSSISFSTEKCRGRATREKQVLFEAKDVHDDVTGPVEAPTHAHINTFEPAPPLLLEENHRSFILLRFF